METKSGNFSLIIRSTANLVETANRGKLIPCVLVKRKKLSAKVNLDCIFLEKWKINPYRYIYFEESPEGSFLFCFVHFSTAVGKLQCVSASPGGLWLNTHCWAHPQNSWFQKSGLGTRGFAFLTICLVMIMLLVLPPLFDTVLKLIKRKLFNCSNVNAVRLGWSNINL